MREKGSFWIFPGIPFGEFGGIEEVGEEAQRLRRGFGLKDLDLGKRFEV